MCDRPARLARHSVAAPPVFCSGRLHCTQNAGVRAIPQSIDYELRGDPVRSSCSLRGCAVAASNSCPTHVLVVQTYPAARTKYCDLQKVQALHGERVSICFPYVCTSLGYRAATRTCTSQKSRSCPPRCPAPTQRSYQAVGQTPSRPAAARAPEAVALTTSTAMFPGGRSRGRLLA